MSNIVTVEANALLESSVTGASYTAATLPIQLALITDDTASTATVAGSEVSGGSYARQDLVNSTGPLNVFGAASGGSITTTSDINFTGMPATTVAGVEIWDSHSGTAIRRWFGKLVDDATKNTNEGDTVTFSAGSLTIALS